MEIVAAEEAAEAAKQAKSRSGVLLSELLSDACASMLEIQGLESGAAEEKAQLYKEVSATEPDMS